MRVVPLNHYQLLLVDPLLQLDSIKNRVSRGCASFSCFSCGGASAGLDTTTTTTPCPLKVEPLKQPVVSTSPPDKEAGKDHDDANKADDDNTSKKEAFKLSLRSSLKRPPSVAEPPRSLEDIKEHETLSVDDASDLAGGDDTGRRKVQWPDACGSELTQVREFEPSEMGLSDEEWETGEHRTCSCVIM
ncbi:BnaA09g30380D [Brassica napus]|uniref:BnaA09g30380D protein n=1 Tax=Brassica napus TaxID=3708 RepID=A0A078G7J8_BRANA|nr:BnaA09g30380D [Brassica napus]